MIPAPTGTQTDDVRSRNLVRPAIVLLLRDHESHGYELIGRLGELGVSVAPTSGALYRLLYTMADEGLITSYWSTPQHGPVRRVYAMTEQGEQHLEASMAALASLARTVRRMLNRLVAGAGSRRTEIGPSAPGCRIPSGHRPRAPRQWRNGCWRRVW